MILSLFVRGKHGRNISAFVFNAQFLIRVTENVPTLQISSPSQKFVLTKLYSWSLEKYFLKIAEKCQNGTKIRNLKENS